MSVRYDIPRPNSRQDLPPRTVQRPLRARRTRGRYRVAKMKVIAAAKVMDVAPKPGSTHNLMREGRYLLGFLQLKRLKKKL